MPVSIVMPADRSNAARRSATPSTRTLTFKEAASANGVSQDLFGLVINPPHPDPPRHRRHAIRQL
jgi:hypothetical protein